MLKIIKHYQEEGQGSEVVQGVLLGLVVDDRLEITNCFPFPQHTEDDADFDEGKREQPSLSVYSIDFFSSLLLPLQLLKWTEITLQQRIKLIPVKLIIQEQLAVIESSCLGHY